MNKPIIFIIIDSVRSFKTGLDDRDKLAVMEKFGEVSIEFKNAFCSAPSSIMSASSMVTGISSAFIARNYNDWKFNEGSSIVSLQSILMKKGYEIFSIDNSKESREMMQTLTLPLRKKFFPKGFSHADYWTNKDICKILENLLSVHKPQKKSFFMLWFDCREDPLTSQYVEESINIFKKYNFYNDSIIFLTSDHGYPDPNSGLTKKTMKGIGHDMIVTDDNIQIPLYLKYPNCSPKKVYSLVSNVDFAPTVLDLLEIDQNELSKFSEGKSMLQTIKNENNKIVNDRTIRIDTRLFSQDNRITALRTKEFKFINYVDQKKHELYDLNIDKNEVSPLDTTQEKNKKILDKFISKFNEYEKKINGYHKNQIIKNLKNIKNEIISCNSIFINNKIPKELLRIIVESIKTINPKVKIYFPKEYDLFIPNVEIYDNKDNKKKYYFDYIFSIKEKTFFSFVPKNFLDDNNINFKKVFYFDFDMKKYSPFISKWFWPIWKYSLNKRFYKDEPKLILIDIIKIFKTVFLKYFLKKENKIDIYQQKQLRDRVLLNEKNK